MPRLWTVSVMLMSAGLTYASEAQSGTNFAVMFLQNIVDMPTNRPVEVFIENSGDVSSSVTVSIPYYVSNDCQKTYTTLVPSLQSVRVVLCPDIRHSYVDGSVARKSVFIDATEPVSVTGYNSEMYSADAFQVLPTSSLRSIYLTTAYSPTNIATQFGILAPADTVVGIFLKPGGGSTYLEYKGQLYTSGDFVRFELLAGETFLAYSVTDLSGIVIWASNPVAVFSGNARTYVDYTRRSRDHIVEQDIPATQFGKTYVLIPTPRGTRSDVVRIVARLKGTTVTVYSSGGGQQVVTLNAGDVFESSYSAVTAFVATRPVSVAVIVRSQEGSQLATSDPNDPSIYFLPSTEQYSSAKRVTPSFLYSVSGGPFQNSYLLITIPQGAQGGLQLDGVTVSTTWSPAPFLNYVTGVLTIDSSATHVVSHIDASIRYSVVIYSASDRESAATALGLSLFNDDFTDCVETPMVPGDGIDNDCDGLVDEEVLNKADDDGDILIDEDCTLVPVQYGTEYAIVFMSNDIFDQGNSTFTELELYVSPVGGKNVTVNITSPRYFTDSTRTTMVVNEFANVLANSVKSFPIDQSLRLGTEPDLGTTRLTDKGIRIQSFGGEVVVYGINKRTYSTDSFLALPLSAAGRVFYAATYAPNLLTNPNDRAQIAVLAHKDGTNVDVTLRALVQVTINNAQKQGPTTFTLVNLLAYQAWEIQSGQDLTGTKMTSDKPFSMFCGNVRVAIPYSQKSRDHLVEQIPSSNLLTGVYSSISSPRQKNVGDLWKVVATAPNTNVDYYYMTIPGGTITHGSKVLVAETDFFIIDPLVAATIHIEADHPVLFTQFVKSYSQQAGEFTDPALIYVPPEQQWASRYLFATPRSGQPIPYNGFNLPYNNSLLIVIEDQYRLHLRLKFNNAIRNIGSEPGWTAVPNTAQTAAVVFVEDGQTEVYLDGVNGTFMTLIFGVEDRESYGSTAGLLFKDLLPIVECIKTDMIVGDIIDNDCDKAVDEELLDGLDNDDDGLIDEDCFVVPKLGIQYYFAYEENLVEYPKLYPLELHIGNGPGDAAVCRVSNPWDAVPSYDATFVIPKLVVKHLAFSPSLRVIGTVVSPNSFLVECNQSVTVFGVNKDTYSADAFVVAPAAALGYDYYTLSYGPEYLYTQYAVIATEAGLTIVSITLPGSPTPFVVALKEREVYQGQSAADLSGTRITADKRVAVFSGDVRTNVKLSKSRDHLVAQVPPISSLGKSFNLVPTARRTVGDVYRVLSAGSNNAISVCCASTTNSFTLQAGEVKELYLASDSFCHLTSTGSVLVARISKSQVNPSEVGDPSLIFVVPESSYGSGDTFTTVRSTGGYTTLESDYAHSLTIIVRAGRQDGVQLNGNALPQAISWTPVSCSQYVAGTVPLLGGLGTYSLNYNHGSEAITAILEGAADRESYAATVSQN